MDQDNFTMYSQLYKENGKWKVDTTTLDGEVLQTYEFDDNILAKNWINDQINNNKELIKKKNKSTKESIRESLKDFINDEDENKLLNEIKDRDKLPIATNKDLPAFNQTIQFDFTSEKRKGEQKARRLMDSMLKLYLSQNLIDKEEYIRAKTKYDQLTLAQLYTQMKISEHAIESMVRAIDTGEIHPRMFEVLGGLQSRILEIMKHQTLHMMAAEENLKKLKHDIDIYAKKQIEYEDAKIISETKDKNITRGTRDIMKNIQQKIANTKGEEFIENEEYENNQIDNDE